MRRRNSRGFGIFAKTNIVETGDRIGTLQQLGDILCRFPDDNSPVVTHWLEEAISLSEWENPWFTRTNQLYALKSIGRQLSGEGLINWLEPYREALEGRGKQLRIGLVPAGNIPLVGFHDFLCILLSGNTAVIKLSGDDRHLLPALARILCDEDPRWEQQIVFESSTLQGFDAIIATGSNNTSRYFEYYFSQYPHIIRHHRNSAGVLTGEESQETLSGFIHDMLCYFGLGCRNISAIYLPDGYDFSNLVTLLHDHGHLLDHHKYRNNYDYNRSLMIMNGENFFEAGPLLLKEDRALASRIAMLHYSFYQDISGAEQALRLSENDIQCIVSEIDLGFPTVKPGTTQDPSWSDYPDHVDVMRFLINIK